MTCSQCAADWCWLCGEQIEGGTTPAHYAAGAGACAGRQMEGMQSPLEGMGCCERGILYTVFAIVCLPALACAIALIVPVYVLHILWELFCTSGDNGCCTCTSPWVMFK